MVKFCFREHDIYTLGYIFLYRYHEQPAYLALILCIISAVVPSKNNVYMQVCVAVTTYIFVACLVRSV